MKKIIGALCLILLLFVAITAFAQEHDRKEKKAFSARIEAGAIWINTTDQLVVDDNNERTTTITGEADSFNVAVPAVMFDLRYTFRDTDTEVYLGTPFEGSKTGLTLGMAHTFTDKSSLDLSIFSGIMGEVWKDPYIAPAKRDGTDIDDMGCAIEYDGIMGTGCNVYYRYNWVDVDQDGIGQRFSDLRRDGVIHSTGIGYRVQLDTGDTITPSVEYSKADMDGKSNSYDGYTIKIGYRRTQDNYTLLAFVSADKKDYDRIHPIFNKTRDETGYSAVAIFTLLDPFGYDDFFTSVIVGYSYADSNIAFFDKRTYISGITIGYTF